MFVNFGWSPHRIIDNDEEFIIEENELKINIPIINKDISFKWNTKKKNKDRIGVREKILLEQMALKEIEARQKLSKKK